MQAKKFVLEIMLIVLLLPLLPQRSDSFSCQLSKNCDSGGDRGDGGGSGSGDSRCYLLIRFCANMPHDVIHNK